MMCCILTMFRRALRCAAYCSGWGRVWRRITRPHIAVEILDSMGVNSSLDTGVPYTFNGVANVLYVIGVAVIPPLVEELGFRGVMLSALRRYGDGFAVVVTALAFGLFHGNPIQIPFAFCVGLALAYIMVRTNNLLLCVIIHALNNGISVFFELIAPYVSEGMYNLLNVTIAYGLILVGAICVVIMLTRYKKQFGSRKMVVMSPWGPQVLWPRPPVETEPWRPVVAPCGATPGSCLWWYCPCWNARCLCMDEGKPMVIPEESFMQEALKLAGRPRPRAKLPVGAVIVKRWR